MTAVRSHNEGTLFRRGRDGKWVAGVTMTHSDTPESAVGSAVVSRATVYRFFDSAGGLLYVGMTIRGAARWAAHAYTQAWWPEVATVTVAHYETEPMAAEAEIDAIRAEAPKYNIIHADRPKPSVRTIRPRNAGSVFRRSRDGRWIATISLGRQGIDYPRRSRSFDSKDAADGGLVEMLAEKNAR